MSSLSSSSASSCPRDDTSLVSDPCAVADDNRRNQALSDYKLWRASSVVSQQTSDATSCLKEKLSRSQTRGMGNFNPESKDLFGRIPDMTRERGRIEIFPRWTNGVPNMDKGGLASDVDSMVKFGALATHVPSCHTLAEKDYDRFQPLVPMLAKLPESVYNTDLRVGKFTRDPGCARNQP